MPRFTNVGSWDSGIVSPDNVIILSDGSFTTIPTHGNEYRWEKACNDYGWGVPLLDGTHSTKPRDRSNRTPKTLHCDNDAFNENKTETQRCLQ